MSLPDPRQIGEGESRCLQSRRIGAGKALEYAQFLGRDFEHEVAHGFFEVRPRLEGQGMRRPLLRFDAAAQIDATEGDSQGIGNPFARILVARTQPQRDLIAGFVLRQIDLHPLQMPGHLRQLR